MSTVKCFYCGRTVEDSEISTEYEEPTCQECVEEQEEEDEFFDEEEELWDSPFGAPDNGPTGHGDICMSDADSGL